MPCLGRLTLEVDIEWTLETDVTLLCKELPECSKINENMRIRIRNLVSKLLPEADTIKCKCFS